jgi:hypothetical protein
MPTTKQRRADHYLQRRHHPREQRHMRSVELQAEADKQPICLHSHRTRRKYGRRCRCRCRPSRIYKLVIVKCNMEKIGGQTRKRGSISTHTLRRALGGVMNSTAAAHSLGPDSENALMLIQGSELLQTLHTRRQRD